MSHPTHIVIMGVSGVGKSTTAALLSSALGWPLAEADDFHSLRNLSKMRSGTALNTADREPWLELSRLWMDERGRRGISTVEACSALRREYRDHLRDVVGTVLFVLLIASRGVIAARMTLRTDHFMPLSLLDSQFAELQPLEPDESGFSIDAQLPPDEIVQLVLSHLAEASESAS